MEIGVAEPITEIEETESGHRELTNGSNRPGKSGGNKNNGGGGSGGDSNGGGGDDGIDRSVPAPEKDKTRIVTGFLLLVVMMTFGALIGAYVVIATNHALEWRPFALPFQIWISTALIILSSVSYEAALRSLVQENLNRIRGLFTTTAVFGAAFILSQIIVWRELTNRGLYMEGNPYAGFFYILTAAHALHVLGGIVALSVIMLRTWNPTSDDAEANYRNNLARGIGWYWHFMAVLWLVLVGVLGFWT